MLCVNLCPKISQSFLMSSLKENVNLKAEIFADYIKKRLEQIICIYYVQL